MTYTPLTLLGGITPKNVIHKIESHKLMHALPVATGKIIVDGQPVVILADGTVRGFEAGDTLSHIIGTAITNSANAAYGASKQHGPVDVTVAVKGFAIVYGIAGADLTAGPVKPTGVLDTTKRYAAYEQAVADVTAPAFIGGDLVTAIALNPADTGELIQLLIL